MNWCKWFFTNLNLSHTVKHASRQTSKQESIVTAIRSKQVWDACGHELLVAAVDLLHQDLAAL